MASEPELADDALTTLEGAKRHLHLTTSDHDALLTELINAASRRIERWCGRRFKAADHRQWVTSAHGTARLSHWPIITVYRVASGDLEALRVRYNGAAIRATVGVGDAGLTLLQLDDQGVWTSHDLPFTESETIGQLAAAITALAGWTGTMLADGSSAELQPLTGRDAIARDVALTSPDRDEAPALIDQRTGTLVGLPDGDYLVHYRAGYETVPADLDLLCRELVADAFHLSRRDTTAAKESLGDYAVWLADRAELADRQHRALSPYTDLA